MIEMNIELKDDEVAVIKVIIGEVEWLVPIEEWDLAIKENRTKAVTYNDSIKFVTQEEFDAFLQLSKKIKG